jgi:hypothetical protein
VKIKKAVCGDKGKKGKKLANRNDGQGRQLSRSSSQTEQE